MRRRSPLLLILDLLAALVASQAAFAAATPALAPTTSLLPVPATASAWAAEPEEAAEEGEAEEEEFEAAEEFEFEACEATAGYPEFAEMDEAEEEEFAEEAEECEAQEEAEEETAKTKGRAVTAPAACVVWRAESTVTTLPGSSRVRLTLRYKAAAPGTVAVQLKLKDHKGSLGLERTTKHLGRGGVLHLTTKLGEAAMERALRAREFDIALRAPNTPGYCSGLLEQRLRTHSSKAHGSRVYSSPGR